MTWLQTYTGIRFDLMSPSPEMVEMEDIAHALSQINRFGGHARIPYSVAQHSVLVSHRVDEPFQRQALLHDAAEAYMGDIPSPFKRVLSANGLPAKQVESRIYSAICRRFGINDALDAQVVLADQRMLVTEFVQLFDHPAVDGWTERFPEPYPGVTVSPVSAAKAKKLFVGRFRQLFSDITA